MTTFTSLQQPYILLKPDNFQLGSQYHALQSLENVPALANEDKFDSKKHRELEPRRAKPQAMSRRNARERRRVKMINLGYETLRLHVPAGIENKKLSKVETLRAAVDYIKHLQNLLGNESDGVYSPNMNSANLLDENLDLQSSEDENRENKHDANSPVIKVENENVSSCVLQNSTNYSDSTNKEDKVFIDIAQWLCQNSNNLQSSIKIKGIIGAGDTGQF